MRIVPSTGVKTMQVPWAAPQGRVHFALRTLCRGTYCWPAPASAQTCELLGIGWEAAHEIMRRAVERGLERRQLEGLKYLGMDEKSFRRGHCLHHVVNRFGGVTWVLDVVEERTTQATDRL